MRFLTGLRAFHYTARCGGTTAAAQTMGVSQPTVSAHIGALETRYGVQLFAQVGRRLVLTEFGESILVLTNRLFELEEEARELMTDAQGVQRGHLRISAVGPYNVMRMLATFRKAYPRIFVTLSVGDSSQIVERVLNYQADVGVLVHDVRDERVHSIPFRRQRLVVFAPRNHPLAQRTALTLADLDGVEMVVRENGSTTRKVFEQALAEAGVRVRTTMEIGSRESIREAVACGLGLGVVSDIAYVPDPRLRQLPIRDLSVHSYAHVICLRERLKSRLVAAFIDQLDAVRAGLAEAAAESDPVIA